MLDWNPELYLKFEQERTQPVRDLVARVGLSNPSRILDLGCGPANSTSVIQHRWPHALIMGLDNSMPMIEKAKEAHPDLQFIHADANEDLSSLGRFDLILANASLQWLPNHKALMPRLLESLNPGGALAAQIPCFEAMPVAQALHRTVHLARYAGLFADFSPGLVSFDERFYYDALCSQVRSLDLWTTFYHHVLGSPEAIIQWIEATALRPYLEHLPEKQRPGFLNQVLGRVKKLYPPRNDGRVLFTFQRLFFIACAR